MKQKRSTHNIALALVVLLLLTLFPHHHHEGGAACWVAEVCHKDGNVNDAHTHHHNAEQHTCFWQGAVQKVTAGKQYKVYKPHYLPPFSVFERANHNYLPTHLRAQRHFARCVPLFACNKGKHVQRRGPPALS